MTVLTVPAVLAIALKCIPPSLIPMMVGIAQHESGLDTDAIHHNRNGTVDVGLAQVNSANFLWLGLTAETALDPCKNLAAGTKVLMVRYNGNPVPAVAAAYSADVMARITALAKAPPVDTEPIEPAATPCQAPNWDVWGQQACRDNIK